METIQQLRETLDSDRWTTVSKQLLGKVFEEFMYEDLLEPETIDSDGDWQTYELDFGDVAYRFRAQTQAFDSYRVDHDSMQRRVNGSWSDATDPIQFLLDSRDAMGVTQETASHLIREYTNTLVADAHLAADDTASEYESLLDMPYAQVEGHMEGHPWFTVNKGRIGFGYDDYLQYAPEQQQEQSLIWMAANRDQATFTCTTDRSYDTLVNTCLGNHRSQFDDTLTEKGLDPSDYYYFPVHEWQWHNTVAQLFSADIATDDLVPLGDGPHSYLPQQSIRTLTNIDDPEKPHIKVPLRMLNTIVYRGLPKAQALNAPRVTEVVKSIRDDDPYLRDDCAVVLPGEIASVQYDHDAFASLEDAPYQYHELLGAVWRESVESLLDNDEQPLTLSALMHEDLNGQPVVSTLADRADMSLDRWLTECFDALLHPLLHYLYKYGLVFMPHGTNVILVLDDYRPTRIAIKDYVDEMAVTKEPIPELSNIPDDIYEHPDILHQKDADGLCQHIFCTTFVCVFRYISDLLEQAEGYDEQRFWRQVRGSIERYQTEFPSLADRFDLFKPEFEKLCLNRNRLVEYGYSDDESPPEITAHGTVPNPLHNLSPETAQPTATEND